MKSIELLQQIEAWLSFNQEPNKEELKKMKADIKEHISEQLATPAVSKSVEPVGEVTVYCDCPVSVVDRIETKRIEYCRYGWACVMCRQLKLKLST